MLHWQDFVFAGGSIIFAVALIPSLRSPHKPAVATSFNTGAVLLVFAVTYLTLSLWFSAVTTLVTAGMWLTLMVQRKRG